MENLNLTQQNIEQIYGSKNLDDISNANKSQSDEHSNDSTIGSGSNRFLDGFPTDQFRKMTSSEKNKKKRNSLVIGIQEESEVQGGSDDENIKTNKSERVILMTDNKEFYENLDRGRSRIQKMNQLNFTRNYSAEFLPRVDEDQKEENKDRGYEGQKHKYLFNMGLDKNEFNDQIQGNQHQINKVFSNISYGSQSQYQKVDESIEEGEEKEKYKGKNRKYSLSIFSSNSNSHVNSPLSKKIFADEIEFFQSKKNREDNQQSEDEDEDYPPTIIENDQEEIQKEQTPGRTEFGQALEKLNEDMQYLNRIKKGEVILDDDNVAIGENQIKSSIQEEIIDEGENEEEEDDEEKQKQDKYQRKAKEEKQIKLE